MKTFAGIFLSLICAAVLSAEPIDVVLRVATRAELIQVVLKLEKPLGPETWLDLQDGISRIERFCDASSIPEFSDREREQLLVAMVDRQTPRQIILIGAALAVAKSEASIHGDAASPSVPVEARTREWEYRAKWRAIGIDLVKKYGISSAEPAKQGQPQDAAVRTGQP